MEKNRMIKQALEKLEKRDNFKNENFSILKLKAKAKRTTNRYGVSLTRIQAHYFDYYLGNNPELPAPNTLTKEERKGLVLDWLNGDHVTLIACNNNEGF